MKKLRALLVGENVNLIYAVPALLHRSGFIVDVITINENLKNNKFIREYEVVEDAKSLPQKAVTKNLDLYDFIGVCDEATLRNIINSDITAEQKLKLLPVKSEEKFQHLFSKVGLSKILSEAQITTPSFFVATSHSEALEAAQKLEYPVMIKVDSSCGGYGVFECSNESDIQKINLEFLKSPFLVQKKIMGRELDLSALYLNSQLINFGYCVIEKVVRKFGASSLRNYKQLGFVDEKIFLEMQKLGSALGADGFVTVSCIESQDDGKIYFIEADMKPNVWVDHGKFMGDDLAIKISKYFSNNEILQYPQSINKEYPETLLIPYFLRLSLLEILLNRYKVWKFMTAEDAVWLLELLRIDISRKKKICDQKVKIFCREVKRFCREVKRLPTSVIRIFLPEKEDRLKIRISLQRFKTRFTKIFTGLAS